MYIYNRRKESKVSKERFLDYPGIWVIELRIGKERNYMKKTKKRQMEANMGKGQ